MTIRHLMIFTKVCETLNMTAAAEQLYITQPAVSSCISDLEAHYKTKLFERRRNKLFFTSSGERLYHLAQKVLESFNHLESSMNQDNMRISVKLGVSFTVGSYIAPQILSAFSHAYPGQDPVSIFSYPTQKLEASLLDSSLDLVIAEGILYSKQLTLFPLMQDELVFVCSRESHLHPELEQEHPYLSAEQLSKLPLLLRDSQQILYNALYTRNVTVHASGMFSCIQEIKRAAACDLGVGLISKFSLREDDGLKEVRVEGGNLYRSISLAYLTSAKRSPALERLIQFILSYTKNI